MSRRRVIAKEQHENRTVYVLLDTEWDEYRVELWIDGEHQKAADHHTDDKQDALQTAALMVKTK